MLGGQQVGGDVACRRRAWFVRRALDGLVMRMLALVVLGIGMLPCVSGRVDAGVKAATATVQMSQVFVQPSSSPATLPNLKPYTPAGWSGPIVVSKVPGTHTDDFPITTNDFIYIDIAIINDSPVPILPPPLVYVTLFLDDQPIAAYYAVDLPANGCLYANDIMVDHLDSGQHTLWSYTDYYKWIQESNEDDNCASRPIGINEGPNPDIRAEPETVVLQREVLVAPGYLRGTQIKAAASVCKPEDWTIHLKSREFDPSAGVTLSAVTDAIPRGKTRGHVLLQFESIPVEKQRKSLESQGVKLLNYVPNKACFASVSAGASLNGLKTVGVRAIAPLRAEDKLSPGIRKRGVGSWSRSGSNAKVRVCFFGDVSPEAARKAVSRVGGKLKARGNGTFEVTLPTVRVNALAEQDEVQWIEDSEPPKTELNDLAQQSAKADVVQAAPYNLTGDGVTIAIWDSGRVDSTHPDLAGRVIFGDSYPYLSEHATHVAGTMAGTGMFSEQRGGTPYQWKGMAPDAEILSYFWDDNILEYPWALITHGAVISQNSWGYVIGCNNRDDFGNYESIEATYDDIVRGCYGRRATICWAAGNSRDDCSLVCGCLAPTGYYCIGRPATSKNMITVGAINSDDDSMTAFSAWGPTDDGRVKPELVAAGCQVGGDLGTTSCGLSSSYVTFCGTSMACPVISGAAALMIERFKQITGQPPLPSTVKALLIQSAVDLGNPGPDFCFGYGKVNAEAAIKLIGAGAFRESVMEGQASAEYLVEVPAQAGQLKVTLAWDDWPGAPNNSISLVNNLDLEVEDPLGTIHYPWVLNPSAPSQPAATGVDNLNVVEQTLVTDPQPGKWKVRVKGTAVPESPQTYSVVCNYFSPQDTILVHNDGISGLHVSSITKQNGSAWLGVAPTAFSVSVWQSQPIGLDVAAAGLDPGDYTENLLLDWNKPEGSEKPNPYPVTVELKVIPRYQEDTAAALKVRAPGTAIRIVGKTVSVGTDKMCGVFYVEEQDRSSGIRIVPHVGTQVSAGDLVFVDGSLEIQDGEMSVVDATVNVLSAGNPIPEPLGMSVLALGGCDRGFQQGTWAWQETYSPGSGQYEPVLSQFGGPNNIGLLVRVCGKVSGVSGNTFYLRDGADLSEDDDDAPVGVRAVLCTGSLPALSVGDHVAVTGVSACTVGDDEKPVRLLRVPDPGSMIVIQH